MMDNQGPTTEGVRLEGKCSLHFLGEEGGILGVEIIGLVGKQQIRGKTQAKLRTKLGAKLGAKYRANWGVL